MNEVKPINYSIYLEPDLGTFLFSGKIQITVEAKTPTDKVTLNLLELSVWHCELIVDGNTALCPFHVDPKKEEMTLSLPKVMAGRFTLVIDYMGRINDKMGGFYRSGYGSGGNERYMGLTQFEESDARRAIPCFDHPAQKATFDLAMVIDGSLTAISNCPVSEEKILEAGRKWVKFQQTPIMSTYLLFFAVGEFEFMEDKGDVTVRAAAMPGRSPYAHFGLAFGRKSLTYCEDYYGIPFPLPKLDLIAISDFAFGAMENWGAITFRENLLLHYPGTTSKSGEEGICNVIAHEMAHQWFGNLVTPSDWKYLWLNESFATFFGYGVVDHYYPEWDMWDRFLESQTKTAMERDALVETVPIEIPGGDHLVINSSTAPIIYNKGGSVLRQVKDFMGEEAFREGLRHYLKKYEYGCASSHNLWESFEDVSKKPIAHVMKSWVEQPGFPLVEVEKEDDRLILTQRRFTYLSNASNQKWAIPVTIAFYLENGHTDTKSILFEDRNSVVPMGDHVTAYKVNAGQSGFFRVKYASGRDLATLGKLVEDKTLSSEDRWGLQSDLYALVKCGEATIEEYLEFLSYYKDEDAYLPLGSIAGNLYHAYLVFEGKLRKQIEAKGRSIMEGVLSTIGNHPQEGEKATTSLLRDRILFHAAVYGSKQAETFGLETFDGMQKGDPVHPDIARSTMLIGAMNGDEKTLDWFKKRLETSGVEHERMNILGSMGHFRDEALIEQIRHYILDSVPQRNKFVPIVSMAANPCAMGSLWDWFVSRLEAFEEFHPMLFERVIANIIPVGGLGRREAVRTFLNDYMDQKGKAKDVIRMAMELLDINSEMRRS